jgi:hypothetical protein
VSALPTPPTPEDVPVGLRDIAIGIAIGSASWLTRYFCSTEKQSLGYIARRTATASLAAVLIGAACKGYFNSEGMAFGAAGAGAYASPELVDWALNWLRKHAAKGKSPSKGE